MNSRPPAQILLGLLIVAAGVVALLGSLGVVDVSLGYLITTWWPLVIIATGLGALASVPRAWIGPVVLIAVGAVLQVDQLGLWDVSFWEIVWPVAVIIFGLSFLTRFGEHGPDDQTINAAVLWWGSQRRTVSQNFLGGSLSAVMGGIDVDLRRAGIVRRADISIFSLWGGVSVKVPPTWRVRVVGMPILGGWEDKTTPPTDPEAPELVVHVTTIMGGAEIKH